MRVAIVAGGTGGHIFPAVALIQELKNIEKVEYIEWITTQRSNEKEIAKTYSINMSSLDVEGIQRRVSIQPIRAVAKTVKAFMKMVKYLKSEKIDTVIAFGGYVCGPVLLAAKFLKLKIYLHEQNSVPGMVNKFFANKATKLFLGIPLAKGHEVKGNQEVVGTPVRDISGDEENQKIKFTRDENEKVVLICGGSQGAVSMNRVLIEAVEWFASEGVRVVWQTGKPGLKEIEDLFGNNDKITIFDVTDNLYPYYQSADLLIGRSGASTISEALLFNIPSILIPLPWSSENHQWFNAGFAEESGYSIRVRQNDRASSSIITLAGELLFGNGDKYRGMYKETKSSEVSNSAKKIANEVTSW